LAGVFGGVPPRNLKRERVLNPCNPPRVGPKTLADPQLTGVGKRGVQGAEPPGGGLWGVSTQSFKRGGELPTPETRHEWDPKRWQTLS